MPPLDPESRFDPAKLCVDASVYALRVHPVEHRHRMPGPLGYLGALHHAVEPCRYAGMPQVVRRRRERGGDLRWLVAVCACAGGLAYTLSGRRWLRLYRGDPATHARAESAGWLVVISALALAALALLVLVGH